MLKITESDIKRKILSVFYARGLDYFNSNRVVKCNIIYHNDNSILIEGIVKGGEGHSYIQTIQIEQSDEYLSLEGSCSCPVEYNCEHISAVCIYFLRNIQNQTDREIVEVNSWLSEFETKDISIEKTEFLIYRFFSNYKYIKNNLNVFKSKFLKNGKISKGELIDFDELSFNNLNYLFDEVDKEIILMLKGLYYSNQFKNYGIEKLEGELGYLVVKKIIDNNKGYFEDNKEPLKFDNNSINPKIYFYENRDKKFSLTFDYGIENYKILNTNPPLLIDIKNNLVKKIEIDNYTFSLLKRAPKIDKHYIAEYCSVLLQKIPNIELNIPNFIESEILDTNPTPYLFISNNFLKLKFKYGDYLIDIFPEKKEYILFENGKQIKVLRKLEIENRFKEKISNFNFQTKQVENSFIIVLNKEKNQESLKRLGYFLNYEVENLKQNGWEIVFDKDFNLKFDDKIEIVIESEEGENWFNLSFNLEFNGKSQPIAPLVSGLIEEFDNFEQMPEIVNIEVENNYFVEVKTAKLKPIIKTIIELFNKKEGDKLKLSNFDTHLLMDFDDEVIWRGEKKILELSKKLKDFSGIEIIKQPKNLKAKLRDYQLEGLSWLNFLHQFQFGGILADDMGLGKTIQTLAHLLNLKEKKVLNKPSLIVVPTSLLANWKNEIKRFTPDLSLLTIYGNERDVLYSKIQNNDIILITYTLVVRDIEKLKKTEFLYIILDEAQKIKNPKTKITMGIKSLKGDYKLALTGTPIENHLGELWSIFSFLMPGFLGTQKFFKDFYQNPIEKERNFEREELLKKRLKPFILRRTKEKVIKELPPKTEIIKLTQFGEKQMKLYEAIRVTMEKRVKEAIEKKGLNSSHITILDALLKLRQVCCDPSLLKVKEAKNVKESAKLELFLELVDDLLEEGRKILVFSQFTSMLKIIEDKIIKKNIKYSKLIGSTKDREQVINQFRDGETDIFLISLKAGGVGLNLVEADTIIHYDPWWNPAVENQATDRVYRIGQDKPVFVYKLIVENSIEQKILELQKKKKQIEESLYDFEKQQEDLTFSGTELLELLK